ncbi:ABC transporter ATP-binding protein [Clostridium sporogenes]|uniref:ABC transporter ATP-binding protein n=2 Tax=Clostridium TaxID=1485 RepID=UPI001CF609A0|nr:ABC transporter ATP-binding protein [Clostridium sporogenes]MCW6086535.1 ABC transporter ATP-binding protein [Clostridium sporogenes]
MLLSVSNLSKLYDNKYAVKDINFSIKKGEIVGLVGENGSGKTSTIKSILKLIRHNTGIMKFEGKEYNNIFDIENKICYIPDEPIFYNNLTCIDNIEFIGRIFNDDISIFNEKYKELVRKFDFEKHITKYPEELSKGNKQKLMLILGSLQNFKLMIADEPFTGLDPVQIKVLKEHFISIKEEGKSVMISTHLLDIAESICDRVVIIDKGIVVVEDTIDNLKEKYNSNDLETIYLKIKGEDI